MQQQLWSDTYTADNVQALTVISQELQQEEQELTSRIEQVCVCVCVRAKRELCCERLAVSCSWRAWCAAHLPRCRRQPQGCVSSGSRLCFGQLARSDHSLWVACRQVFAGLPTSNCACGPGHQGAHGSPV